MDEEFAVGSRVSARGLAWDVIEVALHGAQTLLRLRCAAGDLLGLQWDILHPAEHVETLRSDLRVDTPGTLASWRLHHQACLLEQVLGTEHILLAEPGRVQVEPYQLVPLMRALELPRPRLLLADGVGLGKTIEAGLIACELIARRQAHRVLVVSPAGPLLVQWAQEMRQRFGLRFTTIADAAALQQHRRRLELGGNPFDAIALCITSLDFAKQERVLEELERSAWDLAIIDEAHHCISAAMGGDREETQRRRLAEVVAKRSNGLLLLTATPHDGHDPHFASLIELLDPSLVDGRGGVAGTAYRRHVVRRLKGHIRDTATGAPKFRARRVLPVKVPMTDVTLEPVRRFHRALAALVAPRLRRAAQGREHADALAFVSLLKRSVSTIDACVNTLRAVAERYRQSGHGEDEVLRRERARALRAYRKRLLRFGVLESSEETDLGELETDGMAADLHSVAAVELAEVTRTAATVSALEELIRIGQAAAPLDPKLTALVREVHAIRFEHPTTNILIYTEYADSQSAAVSALRHAVGGKVLAISGLDHERDRTSVAERCAEEDGIILVSTDSLAEGLNLHQRCFNLIHLDLPYNPNRLEQRNGRIDRYGQQREPQIRYLYLAGTFEERLLVHLIAKYEKARAQLDVMPDTLGVTADQDAWAAGLVAGFAEHQANLFDDGPSEVHTLDPARQAAVATRDGLEDGGWLMRAPCGALLRAWSFASDTDLDAPHRTGRAYRFSPTRSAQRVLLTSGERLGLLSDGEELRLLLCDPARPDSQIAIPIAGNEGWRARTFAPDSYRLVLSLATPKGLAALAQLLDSARLNQARITKDLRVQARQAIEGFVQGVLDVPANATEPRLRSLAGTLWEEGLIVAYRLLFILKLESSADPARAFSFASTAIWREALSPNRALGPLVRRLLDQGHDTGRMLEEGLRTLFRIFRDGLSSSELSVPPLGGALFGAEATPLLDRLAWGEASVARLLDRLLWNTPKGRARERVHYGSLDVEDLGRVYEALLELEPGIAAEPMSRLRRAKLEVVVPNAQADRYRDQRERVVWVEDIPAGRFFLRAGIGRKATGSFYTPHEFVHFLVREALAPQIAERSPDADPNPAAILSLKVVDPATGSGHFLVEACRYIGDALYAACRACDELAAAAEDAAVGASSAEGMKLLARAAALRRRVASLPDPNGLLLAYLPSRASERGASGVSQSRALAICRRLVAVHCLYGVDSNRLAVELAKVSLWLESYAEGLPLTFLDHRLVHGDSTGGPFFASLATLPVGRGELDPLLASHVGRRLGDALRAALHEVRALQATVGADAADLAMKAAAKRRLDAALRPLRLLARAWSGAVMHAARESDDEWLALAHSVAATGEWPEALTESQAGMLAAGRSMLAWDLAFPEVFWGGGAGAERGGFDAVLSNPPWDIVQPSSSEYFAGFDLSIRDAPNRRAAHAIRDRLLADPKAARAWSEYRAGFVHQQRLIDRLYVHQRSGAEGALMGGKLDLYCVFAERFVGLVDGRGVISIVVPAGFHANEGAARVRRLYLQRTSIELCLSFENRKGLFDIHALQRFALVVGRCPGPTRDVRCAFYLTDFEHLAQPDRWLIYDSAFIAASGGAPSTFLELRDAGDVALARQMTGTRKLLREWMDELGVTLSRELHMSDDADRFTTIGQPGCSADGTKDLHDLHGQGYLPLHEGKTIHQYSDRWESLPRYAVRMDALSGKPLTVASVGYYRAACREIARSTDERTAIAAMLPPGVVCGHTINVERRPSKRPNSASLSLVGLMNSFPLDWFLRQKTSVHVSLYILAELPVPALTAAATRFLAHATLRLCCNHRGFAALWHEQMGAAWRERSTPATWPAIAVEADRWCLRAAMDAIVAHAYGLDRLQYERVLASFSHKSYPASRALCLAAFDELASRGLKRFCRENDPYDDIPIVTPLAQPAMQLTGPARTQHSLLPLRAARSGSAGR